MPRAAMLGAAGIAIACLARPAAFAATDAERGRAIASDASFASRCADPKVILCDPLDDGPVRGVGISASTPRRTLAQALDGQYRDWRWCRRVAGVSPRTPEYDPSVKASGTGSVRFAITPHSDASHAGYCQMNFTPDASAQFGEGDTFYVQFRVRFACETLYVDCDPSSPGYKKQRRAYRSKQGRATTIKVSIINGGDHPELDQPVNACTYQQLVLIAAGDGSVQGFHSCGWYDGHTRRMGPSKVNGKTIVDRQPIDHGPPAGPHGCFNRDPVTGADLDAAWRDCVLWESDEWMTVTQQVTVGRWADKLGDPARSSNVKVWVAREGQPPRLVIDHDRNLRRPERSVMRYGKVWLVPHLTGKDPGEDHPIGHVWYDELIVSRGPIAPAE